MRFPRKVLKPTYYYSVVGFSMGTIAFLLSYMLIDKVNWSICMFIRGPADNAVMNNVRTLKIKKSTNKSKIQ